MAKAKRKAKRKNPSFRKTKKGWKKRGHQVTSSKAHKRAMRGAPVDPGKVRLNPAKTTGWMKATRVKLVRNRGGMTVLIQKPQRRRRSK